MTKERSHMSSKTMYPVERVQLQQTGKTVETQKIAQTNRREQKTAKKKKRKGSTKNAKKGAIKGGRMAKRKSASNNESRQRARKKKMRLFRMTTVSSTN